MKKIFLFVTLFTIIISACVPTAVQTPSSTDTPAPVPAPESTNDKYIIGYYPSWAPTHDVLVKDIPAAQLTHINYAFSNVSESGECVLGDPAADVEKVYSAEDSLNGQQDAESDPFHGNFHQLLLLKQKYPHLKVLISVGGWSWSGNFSNAAQGDHSRQQFVASCIDLYLKQYPGVFDGIDVDWEYPVSGGMTPGRAEDKINFTRLLGEFRMQLDQLGKTDNRHYLLTIAAPAGPGNIRNLRPELIAMLVDWINVMTYDFHATWEQTTNFNAPLFQAAGDPADSSMNVDATIQKYISLGVPPEKLVLGVPFYGYGWAGVPETNDGLYQTSTGPAPGTWEAGAYEYKDIAQNYLNKYQRLWSAEAYVPWLYDPESQIFITYDDPQSLEAKAGYASDSGLAGIMIWELSQGDSSLLDAIHKGLASSGPPRPTPIPTVMVPRPNENQIHSVSGITLDGKLDDWSPTPDVLLNDKSQVVYSLEPNSWDGPQDLSAEIWRGWAEDGLYLAFKVTDDVHVQPNVDAAIWHGDHIELQIDTQLEKDFSDGSMSDDDYQIGLSLGDYDQVPPTIVAWFNGPAPAAVLNTVPIAYTTADDGYTLEVFIPKETLAGITLAEGATFGMSISPSDTDNEAQGQKVMLSTSPIRTYADPRTFGKITLVK
jgi:chitinase